jgi:transposase
MRRGLRCAVPDADERTAPQRQHDLREMLRQAQGRDAQPSADLFDGRTLQSSCETGARAGYDGYKRRKGSKVHMAVDTLRHLLALRVTPANEQERAQVVQLAEAVQAATGDHVEVAFVDQGYTGEEAAEAAQQHGIRLEVVKLPAAKQGFVLLPRRWAEGVEIGVPVFGAWPGIMNAYRKPWPACISWSSPSSCSFRLRLSGKVHNTL